MFKKIITTGSIFFLIGFAVLSYDEVSIVIKNFISPTKSADSEQAGLSTGPCAGKPCNVILIVADTLSAENMSLYGYQRETTPFLTDLAKDKALVFDNMVASAAWTPPSMIALFFSDSPHNISFENVKQANGSFIKNIKDSGVDVVAFTKVFQNKLISSFASTTPFVSYVVTNNFSRFEAEQYPTDYYKDDGKGFVAAREWLSNRDSEEPYFMFIHDVTVHDPYHAPKDFQGAFDEGSAEVTYEFSFESPTSTTRLSPREGAIARLAYDQEVLYLDSQIREFVDGLGDLDNTIIIITGDHGETFGEIDGYGQHGRPKDAVAAYASNHVVHVPLIIFGGPIEGARNECVVSTVDIAPTVLELFSIKSPQTFKGKSVLTSECKNEIVYSEQSPIDIEIIPIFASYGSVSENILLKRDFFEQNTATIIAARDKRFKVIEGGGVFKVFDLLTDKKEEFDLSDNLENLTEEERVAIDKIRTFIKEKANE